MLKVKTSTLRPSNLIWIFSVPVQLPPPAVTKIVTPSPTSSNVNFNLPPPPTRSSELFSDWLKITRARVKPLHRLLSSIINMVFLCVCVCVGGVNRKDPLILSQCKAPSMINRNFCNQDFGKSSSFNSREDSEFNFHTENSSFNDCPLVFRLSMLSTQKMNESV